MIYPIPPTPKPRMNRADSWRKPPRPCVARYRAFCDLVALHRVKLPYAGAIVTFFIPMPKSWSAKKRAKMLCTPHQANNGPDVSNLLKALEDAVYPHKSGGDSRIWHYAGLSKLWSNEGKILIEVTE